MEHDAHASVFRDVETRTEERVKSATPAPDPVSRKRDPVHGIRTPDGDRLPIVLGQMRYDKYIREQSNAYRATLLLDAARISAF